VLSPYSYLVELDGKQCRLHANKLRKFHYRVEAVLVPWPCENLQANTCAVIYERDSEFGEVPVIEPKVKGNPPSNRLPPKTLAHLPDDQRQEILEVLDRYGSCFKDTSGFTDKVVHNIIVTPDFRPKRLSSYRVLEKLKPNVDKQLQEMLGLGIIRPSQSPMASPLVCVLKKNGGVRLAIDYRYLNSYTVSDEYPVPDISSLLQRVGNSQALSVFDAKSAYWQTPVNPDHMWLTAFICDAGLFEFTRTPFGCKNAGRTFIRAIEIILRPPKKLCESYVDDMCVHSSQKRHHLMDLERFLRTIKESGGNVGPEKVPVLLAPGATLWTSRGVGNTSCRSK